MFHSQCVDLQAARCDSLVAIEAGVGRRSGINHGEIWLELDEPIIPGLNYCVNNTRVKLMTWCFCDWRIGTAKAPCLARQHRTGSTSCANSVTAALEPHSRHELRFASEGQLSDSRAEIKRPLDSSGSARNGHQRAVRHRPVSGNEYALFPIVEWHILRPLAGARTNRDTSLLINPFILSESAGDFRSRPITHVAPSDDFDESLRRVVVRVLVIHCHRRKPTDAVPRMRCPNLAD